MRAFAASLAAAALLVDTTLAGAISKRQVINEAVVNAGGAAVASAAPAAATSAAGSSAGSSAASSPAANSPAVAANVPSANVAAAVPAAAAPAAAATTAAAAPKVATASSFSPVNVASTLLGLGFKNQGQNSNSNNGQCWIGSDGPNTNVVTNGASESIIVVVWGAQGSWMTNAATPPLITVGLQPGQSTTISCADISGGMAAVYGNTKISPFGQIDQTWVEFTYGQWGTVDVSREVNMNGNPVSVVGSKCTTNMSTCVFTCNSGTTCMAAGSYTLQNCGPQNGGQSDSAAMNGGCFMGPSAKLTTTFS